MSEAVRTTKATYALIAEAFAERARQHMQGTGSPEIEADLDFIAAQVPGGLVADIGCGPGRDSLALRSRALRVVGLDLSDAMLRAGSLTGMAQADMRALPVRAGSLDAIWCQAAFLHIPHEYARTVLSEFARTVRPGGVLHLAVAEGDGEGWEVASNYGSDARRWFCRYRQEALSSLLTFAGFEVLSVRRWTYYRDWLRVRARRA